MDYLLLFQNERLILLCCNGIDSTCKIVELLLFVFFLGFLWRPEDCLDFDIVTQETERRFFPFLVSMVLTITF